MTEISPPAASPALQLQYEVGNTAPVASKSGWRIVRLLLLLPGLVLPFLPIECNLTPAKAVFEGGKEIIGLAFGGSGMDRESLAIWFLSIPFFLAFAVVAWMLLRMLRRRSTPAERRAGLAIGAFGTAAFMMMLGLLASRNTDRGGWIILCGAVVAIVMAGWLLAILITRPGRADDQVTVALVGPYAVTLVFCLVTFFSSHDYGYFVAIPPALGSVAELIAISFSLRRPIRPSD